MNSFRISFCRVPASFSGSSQFLRRHTLLFRSNDIHRHDRQNRTIHGHGNRHPVQRDTIEQNFHIRHAVDRDTRFTHITYHTRVI
jgi:hypothetical protein